MHKHAAKNQENLGKCEKMQQRLKEIMENVENAAKKQGTCLKCRKMQ